MRRLLCCWIMIGLALAWLGAAQADQGDNKPPDTLLDAIFPVLRGKQPPHEPLQVEFQQRPEIAPSPACGLPTIDLIQRRGADTHTFRLLGEPLSAASGDPKSLLIRLRRMTVDADGSRRAYHPDDPFGIGVCTSDGKQKICALDYLSNAEIHVYEGSKKVPQFHKVDADHPREPNPAFATAWQGLWAQIARREDRWVDLGAILGKDAPDDLRLYYAKDSDRAVTFSTAIIPFEGSYPCQRGGVSDYFVGATTPHPVPPSSGKTDACDARRYLDSTQIAFFVLPGGVFKHLRIGDIAVGLAKSGDIERLVFGVVGDIGPRDQIGEASIQFIKRLRGSKQDLMNSVDTGKLDIKVDSGPGGINTLAVLVLGGTAKELGFDYSQKNIEKVGRRMLAKWLGGQPGRLQACAAAAIPNPLEGFEGAAPN